MFKYVPHAGVAKRLKERREGLEKIEKALIMYIDIPWADEEAEKIASIMPDSEVINATNVNNVNKENILKELERC